MTSLHAEQNKSRIRTLETPQDLRALVQSWKAQGLRVAFVPTMGALHDGHLSLMHRALEHADRCVASIFVNPTQFAPHEDFASYPRDIAGDIAKLETAGVHAAYTPDAQAVYPDGPGITTRAGKAAQGLETDFRPHFFDGVATVVRRLFEQVAPDCAVFGEKDFQQLMVIREMVDTLGLPVEIIGGPISRDAHGLALSSRNAYLSPEELAVARQLNIILRDAAQGLSDAPDGKAADIIEHAKARLTDAGFRQVDYIAPRWGRLLAASWIGRTRLLDNWEI